MGKTAFEKIVGAHCVKTLPDGSMVLKVDMVCGHEITPPNGIVDAKERGLDFVFDPNKVKMMVDHVTPAGNSDSARQHKVVRDWSREHNVEFLDVGRGGICHRVIPESGWALPGQVLIMPDSHTCTHGAMCAFAAGIGTTEWQAAVLTGLWVCPPQKVVRVNFVGELPPNVYSKDLILRLIGQVGVKGFTNKVVELCGPVIQKLSVGERMTITNMIIEAGGTCGMTMVDEKTVEFLWPCFDKWCDEFTTKAGITEQLIKWNSDPDAQYDEVIDIDVSGMVPLAAVDGSPGKIKKVFELAGAKVDQVVIGSCTNGGLADLMIAAYVIEKSGGKIHDNMRCVVIPATRQIYMNALELGVLETFIKAGCSVHMPTCGPCLGMSCGVIAPDEVCWSTSNRNFPGRMSGGNGGEVVLVSPATAAATAVAGYGASPQEGMCADFYTASQQAGIFDDASEPTDWKPQQFEKLDYVKLLANIGEAKPKPFGGKVFVLPVADVDTDQIIPANRLNLIGKQELGQFCLTGLKKPLMAGERVSLSQSRVLVAGPNFGCGSSREHAPWALEGVNPNGSPGITCVIAPSFARIFYNNMFANGLICIKMPKEVVESFLELPPESIEIDWEKGWVILSPGGSSYSFELTEHEKNLVRSGGLVPVMLKLAAELQQAGKL